MNPMIGSYDPATFRALSFYDAVPHFVVGTDSPSAYLERCLAAIDEREPVVQAWMAMRVEEVRAEAAAADDRYRAGSPLSAIDGMPVGVKDLLETRDLPTGLGIAGNENARSNADSASVQALRAAGALILGKTVTTELGGLDPAKTTNPFSPQRTPGGSSSGSAAAIGAGMIPVGLGTQVGGSIIRPAGFCGTFALKPTLGALNRGELTGYSHSVLGALAGSLEDAWLVAMAIAQRVGGDPGHPGLYGSEPPPAAMAPARIMVLETAGWARTDADTQAAFESVLDQLRLHGVSVLRRDEVPALEAFELEIADIGTYGGDIVTFEARWSLENFARQYSLSPVNLHVLEQGRRLTLDDYRRALSRRDSADRCLRQLAPLADLLISPTAPGPATPLDHRPLATGDGVYNLPISVLGLPAVAVPLMGISGLPVGLQLAAQKHDDYRLIAYGKWMAESLTPVAR